MRSWDDRFGCWVEERVTARRLETQWRRGSECGNGECVEVAAAADSVLVRSSQRPEVVLEFTASEWRVFARALQAGEFDDLS
jgi:Domain of unknown function (DUF397)